MNPIPLLRRAALALCGLALVWTASPVQAQTDPPTRVVRVAEVQGQALWFDTDSREWQPLLRNQTLTEGDPLRVDPQGRVGLRVGPHALWLDERSQMELMRVDDGRLELGLDRGSVALRLVTREGARETRVRTPEGRFHFDGVGDYRVDVCRAPAGPRCTTGACASIIGGRTMLRCGWMDPRPPRSGGMVAHAPSAARCCATTTLALGSSAARVSAART